MLIKNVYVINWSYGELDISRWPKMLTTSGKRYEVAVNLV